MLEQIAADQLAALGNRTRLRVFRLLVRTGRSGLNFGDVQTQLDIPASTLAHHIGILAKNGLIIQHRTGRESISCANHASMNDLIAFLGHACCEGVDHEHVRNTA